MAIDPQEALVRLDLNNPVFQENLLALQKTERHAALDTLKKIRQLTWSQLYRDKGLKWEKITSIKPPKGIEAVYSLRITQSRRCTAYRENDFIRLLTIATDHDPLRTAILLLGGDKTGADNWYEKNVPIADKLYGAHLDELRKRP